MSFESKNNPYWLESLPASEQQFIQGCMIDLEFQTTEDKMIFNNLYQRYFPQGEYDVHSNGIMD